LLLVQFDANAVLYCCVHSTLSINTMPQKKIKLEDTNLALYNSKLHKDANERKAQAEREYKGCGRRQGVEIWRIEDFGVQPWPKNMYGTFYSGDSYIVLHSKKHPSNKKKLIHGV
jgi:gelsolin